MKEITIIGAGLSGLALSESLREKAPSLKITHIDKDKYYIPHYEVIAHPGDVSRRLHLAEWAAGKNIEFVQDSLDRINPRRKKLFLKNSEPRDFETLVVATGLISKKIEVKGEHREGFFYLSDIDPFKLKDLLQISREAAVYVSTWVGIKLIFSLTGLGKEVTLVAKSLDFLGAYKERVLNLLSAKKVALYPAADLEEAVGEGTVKAVKIQPLKVFSSQFLFIDSGLILKRDFFEEEITISNNFSTNFQGLYLLGDCSREVLDQDHFFNGEPAERLKKEAQAFSDFILGGSSAVSREDYDISRKPEIIDKFLSQAEESCSREAKKI